MLIFAHDEIKITTKITTISIIVGCMTILIGVFLATSNKNKKFKGDVHAN